jgi:hypothetical protein
MEVSKGNMDATRTEIEKPIGGVFIDVLTLTGINRAVTKEGFVTSLTFQPRGALTIELENGRYNITTKDCAVSVRDSTDGTTALFTVSPSVRRE